LAFFQIRFFQTAGTHHCIPATGSAQIGGLMVRDAALRLLTMRDRLPATHVDLILRSPPQAGVSKDVPQQQDSTRLRFPATQSHPDFAKTTSLVSRGHRECRMLAAPTASRANGKSTRQQLHNLIAGRSRITPEMAVKLEKAIGSTADTWLRIQMNYDLAQVRKRTIRVKRLVPT
jgi:addiction module HigA family antidote